MDHSSSDRIGESVISFQTSLVRLTAFLAKPAHVQRTTLHIPVETDSQIEIKAVTWTSQLPIKPTNPSNVRQFR